MPGDQHLANNKQGGYLFEHQIPGCTHFLPPPSGASEVPRPLPRWQLNRHKIAVASPLLRPLAASTRCMRPARPLALSSSSRLCSSTALPSSLWHALHAPSFHRPSSRASLHLVTRPGPPPLVHGPPSTPSSALLVVFQGRPCRHCPPLFLLPSCGTLVPAVLPSPSYHAFPLTAPPPVGRRPCGSPIGGFGAHRPPSPMALRVCGPLPVTRQGQPCCGG